MIWPITTIAISASIIIIKNASKFSGKSGRMTIFPLGRLLRSSKKFPIRMKGFENPMSIIEAYRILNIPPMSSLSRVRESHRQLMLRNHPDNGGSNYIASKVNEAKELICGEKK